MWLASHDVLGFARATANAINANQADGVAKAALDATFAIANAPVEVSIRQQSQAGTSSSTLEFPRS
jgi:hypothetical protein